jgi:hypothetical protein
LQASQRCAGADSDCMGHFSRSWASALPTSSAIAFLANDLGDLRSQRPDTFLHLGDFALMSGEPVVQNACQHVVLIVAEVVDQVVDLRPDRRRQIDRALNLVGHDLLAEDTQGASNLESR